MIEVTHNARVYYFSCRVHNIFPKDALGIGASFARSLNIQESDEVFASAVKQVFSLSSINIVPLTVNDRELLVHNSLLIGVCQLT